jgi:hypothetical protein
LTYNCTCADGTVPNLLLYANTLPTYLCQQELADCIVAYEGSQSGQAGCRTTYKCSNTTAPTAGAVTTTASSTGAGSTATGSATTTASASATSATKGAAIMLGAQYGTGIVAAGIALAFSFLV